MKTLKEAELSHLNKLKTEIDIKTKIKGLESLKSVGIYWKNTRAYNLYRN